MKVYQSTSTFDYDWAHVSTNHWQKYSPWNEKTPHVKGVDTLSRYVELSTGILRTERLLTCHQPAPSWLTPFLGANTTSHIYEISYINPHSKTLTLVSQNLTWADILTVRETVAYAPHEDQPDKTQMRQICKVTALCGGWQKIRNKIEMFTIERFGENAAKGREGFEMVLRKAREAFREEREQRQRQGRGGLAA